MTPERFIELIEDAVLEGCDGTVRRYSGRAMYGKQCVGFDTNETGHGLVATVMSLAAQDADEADEDEMEALVDTFRRTRMDDMGRGVIVYWPSMEWPEGLGG